MLLLKIFFLKLKKIINIYFDIKNYLKKTPATLILTTDKLAIPSNFLGTLFHITFHLASFLFLVDGRCRKECLQQPEIIVLFFSSRK